MRIIVNHLTRMAPGYICVAGIDPETRAHIRPTIRGRLSREVLLLNGGPFDLAGLVDLGEVTPEGAPPEVEDHAFHHWGARYLETATPTAFWSLNQAVARPTFTDIFGPDLTSYGRTCAIAQGKGLASLACLAPARQPLLVIERSPRGPNLRLQVSDGVQSLSLPVTDLRLYEADQMTVRAKTVDSLNRRLQAGVKALLAVGLSRAFRKDGESEPLHWLQVNNLHLEDRPIWRVGAGDD